MEQVENFKENESIDYKPSSPVISYASLEQETGITMVAEDISTYR